MKVSFVRYIYRIFDKIICKVIDNREWITEFNIQDRRGESVSVILRKQGENENSFLIYL